MDSKATVLTPHAWSQRAISSRSWVKGAKGPHGLLASVGRQRTPVLAVADVNAGGIGMKKRPGGLYFLLLVGSFLVFLFHASRWVPGPRVARKDTIF